jgi:3-isopropylmalate dehydrogenase
LNSSPVKREVIEGTDLLVFRELTGGIYFAEPKGRGRVNGEQSAFDTLLYRESEIRRIVTRAFEHAKTRRRLVTSVDKVNVLESSRFWREIAEDVAAQYPAIKFESILVDAFAMRLILSPRDFDVVVTGNMFGDIITDEMSVLAGSLGLMPSASLGDSSVGLYEPIHGSAPDIAGRDVANPMGTILSAAMLLEQSLGLSEEARAVEDAVEAALAKGFRTADIVEDETSLRVGTTGMGDAVITELIS